MVKKTLASSADPHILYEQSVQCAEAEIDFVDNVFKKLRKRKAKTLREDFCGTMSVCCEWVKRRKDNLAYGIDLDQTVLEWGQQHNINQLKPKQAERIHIIQADVTTAKTKPMDIAIAMNFSYWLLRDRQTTINYFRHIYKNLVKDGIFFLDAYGGYESFMELEESTKHKNFTYVWDQAAYNPINGISKCHIHFHFKDGSKLKEAFTYEWRLWNLPEITEMLTTAGFKPTIYWEQTGDDGEGNDIYEPATVGEADAGWVAYIVAEK